MWIWKRFYEHSFTLYQFGNDCPYNLYGKIHFGVLWDSIKIKSSCEQLSYLFVIIQYEHFSFYFLKHSGVASRFYLNWLI